MSEETMTGKRNHPPILHTRHSKPRLADSVTDRLLVILPLGSVASNRHFDYSAIIRRYLRVSMPLAHAFFYRRGMVGTGLLTCATVLVRSVHTKAYQALTSLHECRL